MISPSRTHHRSHRRRHSVRPKETTREPMATAVSLVGILILGLLAEMPWLARSVRAHLLQVIVVAIVALIGVCAGRATRVTARDLLQGASPWLLAVLAWAVLLTLFPPSRSFHVSQLLAPFALSELLRLIFCFGVYYAAAYCLRTNEIAIVIVGVLIVGSLIAFYAMYQYATGTDNISTSSIFGNHEQSGSYIMLLLLVPLSVAISRTSGFRMQTIGQVFALVLAAALLLMRTRSAWLGALVGVLVMLGLHLRYNTQKLTGANRFLLVGPLLIVAFAFVAMVSSDSLGSLVSERATTMSKWTDDASFGDRIRRWHAACVMTRERPVAGWGLGSFPVLQEGFTHQGDPPDYVLKFGTGHSNLAHNYYVQWAAETGCIGLFLYVGAMFAGLFSLISLAHRLNQDGMAPFLGCAAALAASIADMVGAPSYTFPGASALPFLWMGLGVTIARTSSSHAHRHRSDARQEEPETVIVQPPLKISTPIWVHTASAGIALLAVAAVMWAGRR